MPSAAQLGREVAHGREDEGDLLRVVRDVGGLGHHLDHQDRVAARIEALEGRDLAVELVAQNEAEGARHPASAIGCATPRSSR